MFRGQRVRERSQETQAGVGEHNDEFVSLLFRIGEYSIRATPTAIKGNAMETIRKGSMPVNPAIALIKRPAT